MEARDLFWCASLAFAAGYFALGSCRLEQGLIALAMPLPAQA